MKSNQIKQLQKKLKALDYPWNEDIEQLKNSEQYSLGYTPDPEEGRTLQDREKIARENFLKSSPEDYLTSRPASFDWRNVDGRNFISSVKNQGSCGSCVAFGTAASLDGTIRTELNIAVNDAGGTSFEDLSEAQLFYCGGAAVGRNCANGWWPNQALSYAKSTGLTPESCFPYTAGNQSCKLCPDWQSKVSKLDNYHSIYNAEDMKTWLSTRGPLIACFTVYSDFYGYKNGVYRHVSGKVEGGHCICVVGYSDTLGAWLCKNSWGSGWGMSGYFWIAYGQCGIDSDMQAQDSFGTLYPFYDDAYIRDNLSEVGLVKPGSGSWTKSPDIIPNGTDVISDPVTTLTNSYRQDIGKAVVLDQQNYYYTRAKNFKNGANSADFEMYYCPQSLFLYPDLWSTKQLKTSSGKTKVTATATKRGDIMVPDNAFTNVPTSTEHHCLITRVITADHPNPLPPNGEITSMSKLASYIQSHPNMAWRNVVIVEKEKPTFVNHFSFNSGTEGGKILIGMNCVNVKAGSSVAFSSGDPIPSGPNKGTLIELEKTALSQDNQFIGEMIVDTPANFNTTISMSYWADLPSLGEWEITFEAILITNEGDDTYEKASDLSELGFSESLIEKEGIGIAKGVILGSVTVKGK
jgi:C1A family cysteine protease